MSDTITTPARDKLVADAQSLPGLIAAAQVADPALAASLTPKALIASKSPIGTLAVAALSWAVAKYGLGWDAATVDLVAGCGLLAGAYVMRMITSSPIGGILRKAPASPAPVVGATP